MTDLMIAGLSSGLVLAAMAAMAVLDARRAVVDPRLVLALLAAAAVWRYLSPDGDSPWTPWTGMALGIAAVALPIIVAQLRGRRWPLYPGDAMMLGAFGFLLGPIGLAWTMLLGSAFSLAYRVWVQRQRGRPYPKRPRAARPGHDRRCGRGVPVRQFRRCLRCRRTAAASRAGRHGNGGRGNGFPLAGYRARRGAAPGDGTGPGQHRTARINRHTGTGVRATRSRFLPGGAPSPVLPVGDRDGDRGAPGADRRRDCDPARCAADPPRLAGRSFRPARPPRRAERLRLELA